MDILQKNIRQAIDDEVNEKIKNPFCVLPTSLKNIIVHSKAEIPGESQYNVSL